MKSKNLFWVSYSDLMTSMFFIMLVLFILAVGYLYHQKRATEEQLREIKNIQTALRNIDDENFSFNEESYRYYLNANVKFPENSAKMDSLSPESREKLLETGQSLYSSLKKLIKRNESINYLMVVEGNTQRWDQNWIEIPNVGYRLSYRRALSLVNFWKKNGINFYDLAPNCELLIAGSGYFGQSRVGDEPGNPKNRRFTVQITSKVGKYLSQEVSK